MKRELLYRFFSGDATVNEEKQLLDWLDENIEHREELFAHRRVFDAMLIHAQSQPLGRGRTLIMPRWTREVFKYAAVVALMLGVGLMYFSHRDEKFLQAFNTITVPAGQHIDVVLPDGTKVWMNALSQLKYPTFFAGKERRVQLSGEAFFDVTHDESVPFVVETYKCKVEVLGTRFDVEAREESDELSVSLLEGRVKVIDGVDSDHSVVLNPSERAAYRNNRLQVDSISPGENFQWRNGLIAFRNATFSELLDKFRRYYDVAIVVQRKELPSTVFTGKIRIAEGVDHAFWVMQQSADFKVVRSERRDSIIIQ